MKDKHKSYSYALMIVFALFSMYNMSAQSQSIIITGVVTAESDGLPLTGATIAEKDKNNRIINGVVADFNGNYSLKVSNPNNTITFSYVGFVTKQLVPGKQTQFNIALKEDISELDAIVIRGTKKVFTGDFEMDKRRIATAMETIDMKDISETVSTGLVDQLQGRLSGVDIVASSGEPGAGMSIRIRGTSSLNASSEPLIVINGVPFETEIDALFDFGSADEQQYAALIGVSPNDIEEISVLKDAAATAQYGSRAANGVLLIKTKRGAKGKAQFSYSYRGSVGWQPEGMPMLNGDQYSTLIKDELTAVNNTTSQPQIEYDPNYAQYNLYNKNVNWVDEITQLGYTHEHFLGVSGGGEKSAYRVSASYKNQQGTTIGSGLKTFTTRTILDYNISNKLRISTELAYTHGSLDKSFDKIRELALRKMPNQSIYELDEFGNPTEVYFTPVDAFQGGGLSYYNPVAMAKLSTTNVENNRITPTFRLNYKPLKQLTYDGYIAFDVNTDKQSNFIPEAAFGASWTNSAANLSRFADAEFFVMRTENKLIWNPNLGDNHSIFTSGTIQTYDKTSQGYSAITSNSPSSLIQTPIAQTRIEGSGNSLGSSFSQNRSIAYNFMFNYQFLDRYILSGGIRSEGNSRFGSSYRYGTFPSIAAKWILSDEPFMESYDFIDELGLRASYGVNGNSPNFNYGQYNTYSTYNYDYLGERPVYPDNMELTDLRWETIIQSNLGLTYSFFDNRVSGDLEFYKKETKDLLGKDTAIPSSSGFSNLPFLNLGNISNQGFELSVRTKLIQNNDFSLEVNFNIARNTNLITKISEAQDVEDGDPFATGPNGYLKRIQENNPIGSFYGYRYLGVYSTTEELVARDENGNIIYDLNGTPKGMAFGPSRRLFQPGEAKYEDVNNDGSIDRLDVVYLGNANPLLYGGFGPTVRYKNLSFNAFFNFRYNQKVINLARMETESMDNFDNQNTAVLRRWRFEGDVTDIPRAVLNSPVNTLASDRFLEDASFLRMKFITLKYDLPKTFIQKLNFNSASLFVTGTDLLTFTKYSGPDPETGGSSDWKKLGYDTNQTPRSQQITLGVNLSF
ncbi:SusC/RagA family TonB-linked outer membrane protein [Mariniflexile gromovii]|uniref:SusC/RagA family TonB-linked outer membrane protein n=1 Tax=Mariniflexile gromovii TaxID=362523 RepID=A0ABS4BTS8_9FLAO|nr:SusC/RagA family TonB-linked outer membrane protein [Mariniflexile gromovii]MBP0903992.1 SusC/RagA family TonB-linked outer membrane protein [Mariniflexile gromovii]